MARVKRGNVARNRRKKILKIAKGYRGSLSKLFRPANQVVLHALRNAYEHRRLKKRDFRSLWILRINGALNEYGIKYSQFIHLLKENEITLNRKVLAILALEHPEAFKAIVEKVKK